MFRMKFAPPAVAVPPQAQPIAGRALPEARAIVKAYCVPLTNIRALIPGGRGA
jgi:hypothetical protein